MWLSELGRPPRDTLRNTLMRRPNALSAARPTTATDRTSKISLALSAARFSADNPASDPHRAQLLRTRYLARRRFRQRRFRRTRTGGEPSSSCPLARRALRSPLRDLRDVHHARAAWIVASEKSPKLVARERVEVRSFLVGRWIVAVPISRAWSNGRSVVGSSAVVRVVVVARRDDRAFRSP